MEFLRLLPCNDSEFAIQSNPKTENSGSNAARLTSTPSSSPWSYLCCNNSNYQGTRATGVGSVARDASPRCSPENVPSSVTLKKNFQLS